MNEKEIDRLLSPYSIQEVLREVDLKARRIEDVHKDRLLGKVSGVIFSSRGEYFVEIKKYHDLRYGNVLPSMFESYGSFHFSKRREVNAPIFLIARVKKLSDSFLDNALEFFDRYESRNFNWLMIDDIGKVVGNFDGRIIERSIEKKSNRKIELNKKKQKQKLSFSPIQQWLLKCLLLNGIDHVGRGRFGEKLWPFEHQRKIQDYKALSKFSGVSESSCFNFIKLLQDRDFLYINDYEYQFRDLKRLFEMWEVNYLSFRKEEMYLSPIKPIMSIKEWREMAFDLFHDVCFQLEGELNVVMSGHLACQELDLSWSNNQSVIFHALKDNDHLLEKFIKKMKLRASESLKDGIRLVLHKNEFPTLHISKQHRNLNIADPIQLLLDVQYLGGRGKEQADYIYEKILEKHFKRQGWMN